MLFPKKSVAIGHDPKIPFCRCADVICMDNRYELVDLVVFRKLSEEDVTVGIVCVSTNSCDLVTCGK
jgi:hypothetical protein